MSGMLLKDWYLIKCVGKSYLGVLALFAVLALTGTYDITFFNTLLMVLLTTIPMTIFAYDEQAGWDRYAATTPAGRVGVVRGKYLFSFLLWIVSLALALGFSTLAHALHPEKFVLAQSLVSAAVVAGVGLVITDLLLPLMFRFGPQKSRIMLFLVVGVMFGMGTFVSVVLSQSGLEAPIQLVGMLLLVVALGGSVISYFTSLRIYGEKEL